MSGSSYNLEGGKGGSSSSGWALHELAENHQFASGVIVSFLAIGMAFGIIGLIAALPHTNLGDSPEEALTKDVRKMADILDTPQAFVISASQDIDDSITGGRHQWAYPPHAAAEEGGPDHGSPHQG